MQQSLDTHFLFNFFAEDSCLLKSRKTKNLSFFWTDMIQIETLLLFFSQNIIFEDVVSFSIRNLIYNRFSRLSSNEKICC